jgi:hypothetical protein
MANKKPSTLNKDEAQAAAKALEVLFTTEYVSKKDLYKANFMRGIFFSVGTIIGAAVVVTLLLWFLSAFDELPFIGPIVQNIQSSVESAK